jgi:acetyltransferase/esterase
VCVVGGNGDPTVFGPLAEILAPRWTVLTYVRRGFVRSPVDGEVGPDKLGADVEDLAALIERYGGPAVVREQLEDRDAIAARFDAIDATYRREGAQAAMAEFGGVTGVGIRRPPRSEEPAVEEVPAEFRAMGERWPANNAFWFEHEYGPYPVHEPDLAVLREHAARGARRPPRLPGGPGRARDRAPGCGRAASVGTVKKLVVLVLATFGVAHLVRRRQERPAAEVWREATRSA